jgi:hypothetical protein
MQRNGDRCRVGKNSKIVHATGPIFGDADLAGSDPVVCQA